MSLLHIPVLRHGKSYESLDKTELAALGDGEPLAEVSLANAGMIRRDQRKIGAAAEALRERSCAELLDISARAGELFLHETLPLCEGGPAQSPRDYIESLSATTGLPFSLCRRNMGKIHQVFTEMPAILAGLTRGLDLEALDSGLGEQGGSAVSYFAQTDSLGAVLPSNSPGVNSIWMPAIALKTPVVLKPGREEPWTPLRIIQAWIAAGCPPEAFGFYPTDHEGAAAILTGSGRALIFGDQSTIGQYAANPAIQVHGPGWSKVLIGEDMIEQWPDWIDVLVGSILANGGRSCINASAIVVPAHGREIAEALAERLAPIGPRARDDEDAVLAGFANPAFAEYIDGAIEQGLRTPGAEEVTANHRDGPRKHVFEACAYLRPTIVACDSFEHPLANREFLFPYASVVEVPQANMLEQIGPSLVVSAITGDPEFTRRLLRCPLIDRLNLGPIPTTRVEWDQPHEGNLFEFLYRRRAIQRSPSMVQVS